MDQDALSNILQENLLTLLCFDDQRSLIIRGVVEPGLFEGHYREIAKAVYIYIDEQREAPKEHLPDLFDTLLESGGDRKGKQFRRILKQLHATQAGVNADFVMSRLAEFIRLQEIKGATIEAIEILQTGRVDKDAVERIEVIYTNAIRKRLEVFEPGIFLGDTNRSLNFLDTTDEEICHTGIKELDERRIGPVRKGLILFIGLPKRGKTWWLVNLGKNAYLEGRKVLHISLEMSADKMARRYYQALFAMAKRRPNDELEAFYQTRFKKDDLGRLIGFDRREIKPKLFLSDPKIYKKLINRIDPIGLRLNRILVKDFPTSKLTIRQLEAYLNSLEMKHRFIPDLLIVDYPKLMKYDVRYMRLELGRISEELRGIAVERNLAVAIVQQSSKLGKKARQVDEEHAAEDWSQIHTADVVLTYSQTDEERALGLARIFVADAREEADRLTILIAQHYATGQFCLASMLMQHRYWDILKGHAKEEDEDDGESKE